MPATEVKPKPDLRFKMARFLYNRSRFRKLRNHFDAVHSAVMRKAGKFDLEMAAGDLAESLADILGEEDDEEQP